MGIALYSYILDELFLYYKLYRYMLLQFRMTYLYVITVSVILRSKYYSKQKHMVNMPLPGFDSHLELVETSCTVQQHHLQ